MEKKVFTDINKSQLKLSTWNKDILIQIEIKGENGVNYYLTEQDVNKFVAELTQMCDKITSNIETKR